MSQRLVLLRAAVAGRPLTLVGVLLVTLGLVTLVGVLPLLGGHDDAAAAPERAVPHDRAEQHAALRGLPTRTDDVRLHVPGINIDAPVVAVPLVDDGTLDPPADVTRVGRWDGGARPGDARGQTVLTGHSVHGGGGVMDDLEQLAPGDVVRVTQPEGHVDYDVRRVVTWSKDELARNAVDAFGQDHHHGRLVLVSCEGWDGTGWTANVLVFATPLRM